MTNSDSSAVAMTATPIKHPLPLLHEISMERPVPTQFEAKCGLVTSAVSLYRCVEKLDQQIDSLTKIACFLSDQIDGETRETIQLETEELEYRLYSESKEADYQFRRGVTYISSVFEEGHFITETHYHLLEKVDAAIVTLDFSLIEQKPDDKHSALDWERDVSDTRRSEIEAKQELADVYRSLITRLRPTDLAVPPSTASARRPLP